MAVLILYSDLLNHATVETSFDVTQGIQVLWSFDESYTSVLQEISSTNIRWVSQHRSVRADGVSAGWKWVDLPDQVSGRSRVQGLPHVDLVVSRIER